LLLRLTRLTTILLAANRKASWNKAKIRYERGACRWTIWISRKQAGMWSALKHNNNKRW